MSATKARGSGLIGSAHCSHTRSVGGAQSRCEEASNGGGTWTTSSSRFAAYTTTSGEPWIMKAKSWNRLSRRSAIRLLR